MLIDFEKLIKQYKIKTTGLIQIGAHYFEEMVMFMESGFHNFVLVEPLGDAVKIIKEKTKNVSVEIFECALSDYNSISKFYVSSNEGQSSSLLKPKYHLLEYPEIEFPYEMYVPVCTLDELQVKTECNVMVIDTQGSELDIFKGGVEYLKNIDAIFTEINIKKMYYYCGLLSKLDSFLLLNGFFRFDTVVDNHGQGDALYLRYDNKKRN